MTSRILGALVAAAIALAPLNTRAQGAVSTATVTGRILDTNQGLPIPGAHVELDDGRAVGSAITDPSGVFTISNVPSGTFSLLIVARGYQSTRVPGVVTVVGQTTHVQTAIQPSESETGNLKTIGRVVTASRAALATSATINRTVDPAQVQAYAYTRIGDVLANLPGLTGQTSSSVGDDMEIYIRGFNSSETAVLFDGHPMGPIGAFGAGYNFKLSPFWGISNTSVIYGSGAAGLYGVSTIAGAINFESLNPTRDSQVALTQGVGNNDHTLSGFTATGTAGKFGYAFAGAVQGTYGQFPPGLVTQTGLLGASQVYQAPTAGGGTYAPPDLTTANVNNIANTYNMTGDYVQRNNEAKVIYTPSTSTQILASAFDLTTWNDKTGEGDNDYYSYGYQLYHAPVGNNFVLPGGGSTNCQSTQVAALTNASAGYSCLSPQQYASDFSGPAGGGLGRFNDSHVQDYHTRITQKVGDTSLILDGFVDNTYSDEHKSPTGPWYNDNWFSHGFLASDEFEAGKDNDVSLGYYTQHQRHASSTVFLPQTNDTENGTYSLTSNSYFARDTWSPSLKFATFADFWVQRSIDTSTTNFDPRLSFVYHATPADVIRVTGGRAYSEPDPSLVVSTVPSLGAPESLNPVCSAGALNSVGTVANPGLKTETGTDGELSYGHRFNATTIVQIDGYVANETDPILSGNVPLSAFSQYASLLQAPYTEQNGTNTTLQQGFLDRIAGQCGGVPSAADLGWTTNVNAGSAKYSGIDLNAQFGLIRYVSLTTDFGLQNAAYKNIPVTILQNNTQLINGAQFVGIPKDKGTAELVWSTPTGFRASMQGNYIGANNQLNRGPYWYANGAISQSTGQVTVSLGMQNIFNSVAQQWGFIGYGVFHPENQFGTDKNAYDQGTEEFGLPYRQFFMTVKFKL